MQRGGQDRGPDHRGDQPAQVVGLVEGDDLRGESVQVLVGDGPALLVGGDEAALDPAAALSFAVDCPACACQWDAAFDPARSLWSFVQSRAEQTLLDVDALARRYGWNEAEVLALSPTRRRAYLQLAESG